MGVGALKGARTTTRDAQQAYIQSYIEAPGRPRTWVRLPKSWWPKSWFNADGSPKYHDLVCILMKSLYGHPESGALWDKKMHKCMKACGFVPLEGSPGFFHHPKHDVEVVVYVDDFLLIAPPHLEAKIWAMLEGDPGHITFKDPAVPVDRYLGIYHHFRRLPDGTINMYSECEKYFQDAVRVYSEEVGVKELPFVPTPSLEDKLNDSEHPEKGKQAKTAPSHLMKFLYVARLCRADIIVTVSFLARRISKWGLNEDRRLRRLMSYCAHHSPLALKHTLHPSDKSSVILEFSPDAELGGDPYTTKSTGGYWICLCSADGTRRWPLTWACKKSPHSPGSTADSESWQVVGAHDQGLKREVIPLLDQIETSLGRHVKLVGREDNTQCIAAIKKGYSQALRYLKRHVRASLGFAHEVFESAKYKDDPEAPKYWASLEYCPTKDQLGDWMTKELTATPFAEARTKAGYVPCLPK